MVCSVSTPLYTRCSIRASYRAPKRGYSLCMMVFNTVKKNNLFIWLAHCTELIHIVDIHIVDN